MIVSNDFDSRTPLRGARSLARALGMERGLVRYMGSGHTALFSTTACIQDTVASYLVDLRLPRSGFACPARPISFARPAGLRRNAAPSIARVPGLNGVLPKRVR
jgi:hypothetical protein